MDDVEFGEAIDYVLGLEHDIIDESQFGGITALQYERYKQTLGIFTKKISRIKENMPYKSIKRPIYAMYLAEAVGWWQTLDYFRLRYLSAPPTTTQE